MEVNERKQHPGNFLAVTATVQAKEASTYFSS